MGMEVYAEMARLVMEAREHYEQFLAGKKIAAVRARKCLMQIKNLALACRKEIQERKGPTDAPPAAPAAPPPAQN